MGQGPSTHLSQGQNFVCVCVFFFWNGKGDGVAVRRVLSKQDALQLFICQTLNDF